MSRPQEVDLGSLEMIPEDKPDSPEQLLAIAVIARAIRDAHSPNAEVRRSANQWLRAHKSGVGSLLWWADFLERKKDKIIAYAKERGETSFQAVYSTQTAEERDQ